jgi:hypothetical protein
VERHCGSGQDGHQATEGDQVDAVLIAQIVAQVMAILQANGHAPAGRRVLEIFSGASCGHQVGLAAIRQLVDGGHQVTVVFTPAGRAMVGEACVRDAGAHQVILPGAWVDAPSLVHDTDVVLLPTLSMNFAAHLAMGLLDSVPATLVLGSLLAGKPVAAVREGADPNGPGGRVFGAGNSAPALRAHLAGNLKTLASYGVDLLAEADFLAGVARLVVDTPVPVSPPHTSSNGRHVTAPLITQADLAGLPEGAVVRVASGSRLTPLARDTAATQGIELVFEQ